jgi:hypothetical protein
MRLVPRFLLALVLTTWAAWATAGDVWVGVYLAQRKIGYAQFASGGKLDPTTGLRRNESVMVLRTQILGDALDMRMETESFLDSAGKVRKMRFVMDSGGRTQTVVATVSATKVVADVDNNGQKSKKTIAIPKGAQLVDDPTLELLARPNLKAGAKREFYVLDPVTVSLVKNTAVYRGPQEISLNGSAVQARLVELLDPRATVKTYFDAEGRFLKAVGVMGIEMLPEPQAKAIDLGQAGTPLDLAVSTAVAVNPPLERPMEASLLELAITGADLSRAPSDSRQKIEGEAQQWRVTVRAQRPDPARSVTIARAAQQQPRWTQSELYICSDQQNMRDLATRIVGGRTMVVDAALKIREYVFGLMKPNAGIGTLRNADEVLKTKEGVCRDYAILTATLCRAAKIPTRLATGVVGWEGRFYYHAWVEVWTGYEWLGLDATRPEAGISASHIKLRQGTVDEAFVFSLLDGAQVSLVNVKY